MTTTSVLMRETGDPSVLSLTDTDLNWPAGPGDVLVRMSFASVNPADTFFRQLGPYLGDGKGIILGHDGAGQVQAVGPDVTGLVVGDRVCFCNGGLGGDPGTYAQHAVVPARLLVKIPDGVAMDQAAAAPLVFITGWEALVERAAIKPGDKVLIHAGAGGTGHVAIQIAKALGAHVATTVSSADKHDLARTAGADKVINYKTENFVEVIHDWTGGKGVRAVLDNVGPEVFQQSLACLAPYGQIVTLIGTPGDTSDETAYTRNLTIHNVMMLTPMWLGLQDEQDRQASILRDAMAWLADGRLRINIRATFPLSEAAKAHSLLEQGGGTGKILLSTD